MRLAPLIALLLALVVTTRALASDRDDVTAALGLRSAGERTAARLAFERAAAGPDPTASAEALYELAEMDEEDLAFAAALARYERSVDRAPSSRYAPRAAARVDYLRRHAEGGFSPLATLERARRGSGSGDARWADALAREAEAFPAGAVRNEAHLVVADACHRRLGRPGDALKYYGLVLRETTSDATMRLIAAQAIAEIALSTGDYVAAEAAAREISGLDATLLAKVSRLARRAHLRTAAYAGLAAFALLAGCGLALGLVRHPGAAVGAPVARFVKVALPFCAWLAGAGAWLALGHEGGSATPFVALGASALAIATIARAWAAVGAPSVSARTGRALACALAVVAVAFIVLDRSDAAYLESFGL